MFCELSNETLVTMSDCFLVASPPVIYINSPFQNIKLDMLEQHISTNDKSHAAFCCTNIGIVTHIGASWARHFQYKFFFISHVFQQMM